MLKVYFFLYLQQIVNLTIPLAEDRDAMETILYVVMTPEIVMKFIDILPPDFLINILQQMPEVRIDIFYI